MATKQAPVVLIIRDGWGLHPDNSMDAHNAIVQANTPVADSLFEKYPTTLIGTCGGNVGLPSNVMGNSEVGHQNIGAGRIVPQELMRLTIAAESGEFKSNPVISKAFAIGCGEHATHIVGLVSNGRVHSDIAHLFALLDAAPKEAKIYIHVITDGRDCSPSAGLGFVEELENHIRGTNAQIATVIGRYWAMDRDNRWERIAPAYEAMTGIKTTHPLSANVPSVQTSFHATDAIANYYKNPTEKNRTGDEFIVPTQICNKDNQPVGLVKDGDAILFFNYRGDRPREISKAFVFDNEEWAGVPRGPFNRGEQIKSLYFATMTNYEAGLPVSAVAFKKPEPMKNILGAVLAKNKLRQFRCAETEKFPHVTFFFNDYKEEPFDGEERLLIPSPTDVATYDQKPEMSAHAVCQGVLDQLACEDCPSVIIVNFANADMVGHTGNLQAIIKAVEVVDECCGQIIEATLRVSGSVLITADHGNAERTWNSKTNSPDTAHTTFDVPLHLVGCSLALRDGGILADIAPTVLQLLDISKPEEMTGTSLLC
ncbi:MAG TPA: 2,3-bisphosphoglycerate-independent phosphoglycerate mutase [Phycisphaerales bacterium]|nr:2,3-bisphosphoglycerate-independent phosphoglycerate mutase [Phycisphaerales bacterium]HIN83467.1 2,3-bisphosphoglycerate-independent phosphoglycerate mutase [Phycisphaerales bacterium]